MTTAEDVAEDQSPPRLWQLIARAGLTRPELSKASGISTRTIDALARPEGYGRDGSTREVTAWKIARGFAQLTAQTPEAAFNVLFVEVEE